MRQFIVFFAALIIASCKAQTPPSLDTMAPKDGAKYFNLKELSYKRQSRGGSSLITVSSEEVVMFNSKGQYKSYSYPKKEWDSLTSLARKIDASKLSSLTAPTDARLYDGAPAATLSLVINKKSISSSSFDDGYPPQEISDLVFKLLALEKDLLKN